MARIFLSHSSRNSAEAIALRDWLVGQGWNDLFLDLDPESGLKPGERWQAALKQAAERCELVIFLVSPDWAASKWCLAEFLLAKSLNKRIFGVIVEDTPLSDLPSEMTEEWQLVDLTAGTRDHEVTVRPPPGDKAETVAWANAGLDRLRIGLMHAGLDARYFAWPPRGDPERAPYRGLEPLQAEDAGIFFGRDGPTVVGLDKLRGLRESAPPRLVAILGASGAGKSSFLRAGLLPRLARESQHFLPLPIIRPERAILNGETGLIVSLEKASSRAGLAFTRTDIRKAITSGSAGVGSLLRELVTASTARSIDGGTRAPKPPTLVLPVDQTEELFHGEGTEEARTFLELLHALVTEDDPALIVLFTIRSDSYEQLQTAKALEGLRQHTLSLPPMPKGSYAEVIKGPARRLAGTTRPLAIEEPLVDALLADIEKGGAKDALPLLAFTLERLYREAGGDGDLKLSEYEELGGVKGSIEAAVERALESAKIDPKIPRDREARLKLLRRGLIPWLAGVDPGTGAPRRCIARRSEIPEASLPLIDLLVEQHLLTTDIAEDGEATIEPVHDALLRQWSLLHDWLEEDLGALMTLEGVKRAALDWAANECAPDWLNHTGTRLEEVDQLAKREDLAGALGPDAQRYLEQCRRQDELLKNLVSLVPSPVEGTERTGGAELLTGSTSTPRPPRDGVPPPPTTPIGSRLSVLALIGIPMLLVAAVALRQSMVAPMPDKVRIAGKKFLESSVLLEVMALTIESRIPELEVERHHYIGHSREIYDQLRRGQIDIEPDYTGTLLTQHQGLPLSEARKASLHDAEAINDMISEDGLRMLRPFGFNNPYLLVTGAAQAKDWSIPIKGGRIEDLARGKEGGRLLRLGCDPDFDGRSDGKDALGSRYGKWLVADVRTFDHDEIYDALDDDRIDVAVGYATDSELAEPGRVQLDDNRHAFIDYWAAPLVREDILAVPQIRTALESLLGQFTGDDIANLIGKAEKEHLGPELASDPEQRRKLTRIVRDGLQDKGLLTGDANAAGHVSLGPPDGAHVLGSLEDSWTFPAKGHEPRFELWRKVAGRKLAPISTRETRYQEDRLSGRIEWQVCAHYGEGKGRQSVCGKWRTATLYPNAWARVCATGRVKIGVGKLDGLFVEQTKDGLGGAEIDLARDLLDRALAGQSGCKRGPVAVDHEEMTWGEDYFRSLDDTSIDLLISRISITTEREENYGLRFTDSIIRYPQSVLTLADTPIEEALPRFRVLGAQRQTANEALAKKLLELGDGPLTRLDVPANDGEMPAIPDTGRTLLLWAGPRSDIQEVHALGRGQIDGLVTDRPCAMHLETYAREKLGTTLRRWDVPAGTVENHQDKRIGFAVRASDDELRQVLNRTIAANPKLLRSFETAIYAKADSL